MKTKTLYTRDTEKAGISRSPNFYRTGFTTYRANPKFTTTWLIKLIFIMKRTSYRKDFQSWKGMVALKILCCNIVAGRFDWKKYAAMTEGWQ
jgi:threonine/homoserine/homoserine lactone efflux protein